VAVDVGKALVQVIRKIPIFDGLGPSQLRQLLGICRSSLLAKGHTLCRANTVGDEMYILLTGELAVTTAEGLRVAVIRPVTTVGEMAVITGQPRSATVAVAEPAKVLAVARDDFVRLLEEDRHLGSRIYRNLIGILADKLASDNLRLSEYQAGRQQCQGAVKNLERSVELNARRVQAVLDFLVAEKLMERSEAEAQIEWQVPSESG
jgi:CRP-like cAMP-binding protein